MDVTRRDGITADSVQFAPCPERERDRSRWDGTQQIVSRLARGVRLPQPTMPRSETISVLHGMAHLRSVLVGWRQAKRGDPPEWVGHLMARSAVFRVSTRWLRTFVSAMLVDHIPWFAGASHVACAVAMSQYLLCPRCFEDKGQFMVTRRPNSCRVDSPSARRLAKEHRRERFHAALCSVRQQIIHWRRQGASAGRVNGSWPQRSRTICTRSRRILASPAACTGLGIDSGGLRRWR